MTKPISVSMSLFSYYKESASWPVEPGAYGGSYLMKRCDWATKHALETHYLDTEWGVPLLMTTIIS